MSLLHPKQLDSLYEEELVGASLTHQTTFLTVSNRPFDQNARLKKKWRSMQMDACGKESVDQFLALGNVLGILFIKGVTLAKVRLVFCVNERIFGQLQIVRRRNARDVCEVIYAKRLFLLLVACGVCTQYMT